MSTTEQEMFRKLFIGGLAPVTSSGALRAFYQQFGTVVDCIVMWDSHLQRSRQFGFVTFADPSMVDFAMDARPHVVDGKTVDPKRATPREQMAGGGACASVTRMRVEELGDGHSVDSFLDYFSRFGVVEEVKFVRGQHALVEFHDYDSVDKCVLMRQHTINGETCVARKETKESGLNFKPHFVASAPRSFAAPPGAAKSGEHSPVFNTPPPPKPPNPIPLAAEASVPVYPAAGSPAGTAYAYFHPSTATNDWAAKRPPFLQRYQGAPAIQGAAFYAPAQPGGWGVWGGAVDPTTGGAIGLPQLVWTAQPHKLPPIAYYHPAQRVPS